MVRREYETAVVEKKKEKKRCKQHCAASGEMSPIGPFKQCEMPLREAWQAAAASTV